MCGLLILNRAQRVHVNAAMAKKKKVENSRHNLVCRLDFGWMFTRVSLFTGAGSHYIIPVSIFIFHFLFHLILHYSSFHLIFHYPNIAPIWLFGL